MVFTKILIKYAKYVDTNQAEKESIIIIIIIIIIGVNITIIIIIISFSVDFLIAIMSTVYRY